MCAGCMDIVTLIHDETHIPNFELSKIIMETVQSTFYARNKVHVTEEELATFLIVLGSSLLLWEKQ